MDAAEAEVRTHQQWLEKELLPNARGDFRLGAELFDQKLAFTLKTPLTRAQVRQRAEREMVRVRDEMYDISLEVYREKFPYTQFPSEPSDAYKQAIIRAALELAYQDARLPQTDRRNGQGVAGAVHPVCARERPGDLAAGPDRDHHHARVPARRLAGLLRLARGVGRRVEHLLCDRSAAGRLDPAAGAVVPARVQRPIHSRSDHARSHAGALRPACSFEPLPGQASSGAGLRACSSKAGPSTRNA
jgi:hypothetical protein